MRLMGVIPEDAIAEWGECESQREAVRIERE